MAGKAKRKRDKHHPQSRKARSRQRFTTTATQQPAVAEAREPASQPAFAAPPASVPAPSSKQPTVARYPYITAELKMIGILAAIVLIILVVLFLVLP